MSTVDIDAGRVAEIAQVIRARCLPFKDTNESKLAASQLASDASKAEICLREAIMGSLAEAAEEGEWLAAEVAQAAATAAAMSNDIAAEKALATFIGETKRAMDPKVRVHFRTIVELRDLTWSTETAMLKADKNSPTPLRVAFKRSYHMLIRMMGAAQQGQYLSTAGDVVRWAMDSDPRQDAKVVAGKLEKLKAEIAGIHATWPVKALLECVKALGGVTEHELARTKPSKAKSTVVVLTQPSAIVEETADEPNDEANDTTEAEAPPDVDAALASLAA